MGKSKDIVAFNDWLSLRELPHGRYRVVEIEIAQIPTSTDAALPTTPPAKNRGRVSRVTVAIGAEVHQLRLDADVADAILVEANLLRERGLHLLPAFFTFGMAADGAFARLDEPVWDAR